MAITGLYIKEIFHLYDFSEQLPGAKQDAKGKDLEAALTFVAE